LQGDAYLISDNVNGLRFDGIGLLVPEAHIGPIDITNLSFKYIKSDNLWTGGADVKLLPDGFGIHAAPPPPQFGFGIKNGRFDHAGFGVNFSLASEPDLFPPFQTVFLKSIGAGIGVNPLQLVGTIGISAARVVEEDGVLMGIFASKSSPYDFPGTDELGPALAPLHDRTVDSFTLAIGGSAKLALFGFGELPLLNAYGLYEYPTYFEFGGGFGLKFPFPDFLGQSPSLELNGNLHGFVDPGPRLFNAQAGVSACLKGVKLGYKFVSVTINQCVNVGAVVSSKGFGFCAIVPVPFPVFGVLPVPIGAGYKWGASTPDLMVGSCDYGPYTETSPHAATDAAANARNAAASYTVVLPAGLPAAMFRVHAQQGLPDPIVTDPRGQDIASGKDAITLAGSDTNTTLVAIRHPLPGRWTITAKPGSPPITSVASRDALPPPAIKVRVTGSGPRRVLAYQLTPAAGRTVTFAERGAHTGRLLGVAHGRSGRIVFTPAGGSGGQRWIAALLSDNGAPSRVLKVATYRAPFPPALKSPGPVRARRRQRLITVTWTRVAGAVRYEVLVTLVDGSQVFRSSRTTRIVLLDPYPRKRGKVLVDALATDGVRGATASVPLQ
jgi:hypothetical protein